MSWRGRTIMMLVRMMLMLMIGMVVMNLRRRVRWRIVEIRRRWVVVMVISGERHFSPFVRGNANN